MTKLQDAKEHQPNTADVRALGAALGAALARLALVVSVAAWLVILLLNEIAAALVYALAAALVLVSC